MIEKSAKTGEKAQLLSYEAWYFRGFFEVLHMTECRQTQFLGHVCM